MSELTFLGFLNLCKKHNVTVVSAKYELDGRNRMEVELQVRGTFPELGERIAAFMTDLKPYLKEKFVHKYFNVEGGTLDLEAKSGYLNLKFFAKGIGLALDTKEVKTK
jgi:hypothetical protein